MKDDLDNLRALHEAATPGHLDTAEITKDEVIECPVCDGQGEVDSRDYCNFDSKALGVQFYGIGDEFLAHEKLWSATIRALPTLIAQAERANALEAALDAASGQCAYEIYDPQPGGLQRVAKIIDRALEQTGADHG